MTLVLPLFGLEVLDLTHAVLMIPMTSQALVLDNDVQNGFYPQHRRSLSNAGRTPKMTHSTSPTRRNIPIIIPNPADCRIIITQNIAIVLVFTSRTALVTMGRLLIFTMTIIMRFRGVRLLLRTDGPIRAQTTAITMIIMIIIIQSGAILRLCGNKPSSSTGSCLLYARRFRVHLDVPFQRVG